MSRAANRGNVLWLGLAVTLSAFAPGVACAQEKTAAHPDPMMPTEVQRGRTQFEASCAMCHGSEAKGATGPSLIDSSLVRHDDKANLISEVVERGRVQKGMPAFPNLTAAEVADLAAFLHAAVEVADNIGAGGPKRGYSLQRLLTGDVSAGKKYFDGDGGCSGCHSAVGNLKAVASKYSPVELESQMLLPSVDNRTVVVSLPSGEKMRGTLVHLDAFYVSLIDGDGNYHSWPLTRGLTAQVDDPLRAHRELLQRYTDKDIHDLFAYLETLQ